MENAATSASDNKEAVNRYFEIVRSRLADVFADGALTPSDALYVSLGIIELAGRVFHDLLDDDDEEKVALSRFNDGFVAGTLTHPLSIQWELPKFDFTLNVPSILDDPRLSPIGEIEGDSGHSGGTP